MTMALGILLGMACMLGYAFSDYFAAIASRGIGWFETATLSRAVSFTVLFALLLLFFKIPVISLPDAAMLLIAGMLSDIALQLFYRAMKEGAVSIVAPISDSNAAVTVVLLLVFFSIPLSLLESAAISLILMGTVLSAFGYERLRRLNFKKAMAGSGFAAMSALAFGIDVFIEILLVKDLGWFIPAVFIYLVMLAYNLAYSTVFHTRLAAAGDALKPTAMAGLLAALSFLAFNYGVSIGYAIVVTPLAGAATIVTVLLGFALFGEKLEADQKIGILLCIVGILLLAAIA